MPKLIRQNQLQLPSYLVLLRVWFALPAALLPRRCALTAPFHPYPHPKMRAVYSLWHFPSNGLESALPDVIRHTALWSSDFPLPASPPFPVEMWKATVRSSCQLDHYIWGGLEPGVRLPASGFRIEHLLAPAILADRLNRGGTAGSDRRSREPGAGSRKPGAGKRTPKSCTSSKPSESPSSRCG